MVVENQKLAVAQRQLCVGSALAIGELDFKYAGCERLNDGSNLAAKQSLIGQIGGKGDDIEQLNIVCHGFTCGRQSLLYST